MTSLLELLGRPVEMETIAGNLIDSFSETFGLKFEQGDYKWLSMLGVLSG
jgi:hypothetical protein